MIHVLYFARYRELLACEGEQVGLVEAGNDITALMQFLSKRGGIWADVFSGSQPVMVAVNQDMVTRDATLKEGDEVAFFPPVTGG